MKKPSRVPADESTVLAAPGQAEIREQGSRFLAFANPISSAAEAAEFLADLKRRYHDATHIAYAWRIGSGRAAAARSSDAGEPSGTAGRPIADAIASAGVSDAVVAVVRYFGGTKLGTGGLARAYRAAADRAVAAAGLKTIRRTLRVIVTCPYEKLGAARRLVRPPEVALAGESFDPDPVLRFDVPASRLVEFLAGLRDARLSYEVAPPD
jgi:uncharacterized YigZ family protein